VCEYMGTSHAVGESFPAGDGCNTCECLEGGAVSCTLGLCAGCVYQLATYGVGETFPAGDGCNECTCGEDGAVGCTKVACACDPASEWWHDYMNVPPDQCDAIDWDCLPPLSNFQNACGCGCAQDLAACPEIVDCAVYDCMALADQCPLSTFVIPD